MAIRVALHHHTSYRFDRAVSVSPHVIRLRPASHTRTPIHAYSLKIEPAQHFINWMQDPFGNFHAGTEIDVRLKDRVGSDDRIVAKVNRFGRLHGNAGTHEFASAI